MKFYRKDIDGLRSLAIIPVLFFHAGFQIVSGGFVGVDVFFVISGFLITSTLLADMEARQYSITHFYERRIRRIMPAFVVLVLCVGMAGLMLQLPSDLSDLGSSIWSAAVFISNIFFWNESGDYFGIKSEFQPLLHTWSLSVEEQFYVIFPIVLLIAVKSRKRPVLLGLLLAGFVVSFAASIYGVAKAPVATFYLLPTRAWELLAGSLLAARLVRPASGRWVAGIEAAAGVLLILVPVFLYDARTPFPGLAALPPVLGAALILHAGMGQAPTAVARLLSQPVPRFFGLISYSLYLWHWPIIVFARYYLIELDLFDRCCIVIASIAMATLSWHFVERPFRRRDAVMTRRPLFVLTGSAIAASALAGVVMAQDGLPSRVPADIVKMADKGTYHGPGRECGSAFAERKKIADLCLRGATRQPADFLVIGDSHADALAAAVFEAGAKAGHAGYQLTDTGYRPVIGFVKKGEEAKYSYINKMATKLLDSRPDITRIVVPIYWHQAVGVDSYVDGNGRPVSGAEGVRLGLEELLRRYPDRQFLFILPSAHSLAFGGNAAARATWFGHVPFNPTLPRAAFDSEAREYMPIVDTLAADPRVKVIRLADALCDRQSCHGRLADGQLAYADDNHVSYRASRVLVPAVAQFLGGPALRVARSGSSEGIVAR